MGLLDETNGVLRVHVYVYQHPWLLLGHLLMALAAGGVSQGSSNRAELGTAEDPVMSFELPRSQRVWACLTGLFDGLDLVSDAYEFHKGTVSLLGTGVRVGITRKSAVTQQHVRA